MRFFFTAFFITALLAALFLRANAQTCSGSLGDPVINQNFGAGTNPGPALAAGTTTMTYTTSNCPSDGEYCIYNSLTSPGNCHPDTWHNVFADHTGNPNGYMMIVNASYQPSVFFTQQANGLCPNTTYEFSAYILNLITLAASGPDVSEPNITFSITTTSGQILATESTGSIPATATPTWVKDSVYFTTPTNVSDVIVTMTNNAPGGNGNDLILDDITFRACGPIIETGFSSTTGFSTQQLCQGANAVFDIKAQVIGNNSPTYQWQSNVNNGTWSDISGENTDALTVSFVNAAVGQYQYRLGVANGSNLSSIQCRVYSPSLTVNVHAPPIVPSLSAIAICQCPDPNPNEFCQGGTIQFTDTTNPADTSVKTWLWDFGDNTTSVLASPNHLYAKPGSYTVTLTVANAYSCSASTMQTLKVNYQPVAVFSTSATDCAGQNVTLTDKSTLTQGNILKWVWSYGDGKSDTLANNNPFNHIYANTGTDTVKLTVISDGGCTSLTAMQIINVNPIPVVNFSLPAICLNDADAQFNDESTIADNSTSGFTYLWGFGDPNASPTNPNTSTLKNPTHKYSQANNYNITLTVTSAIGCVVSKTQQFTVNGDTPVAAFAVENSNSLCSSDPVVFDNLSTVNFGSLTKITWYFDYNNNPQDAVTFLKDSIPTNNKFYHNYGLFNSPLTKSYNVRMDVYSGITCTNTTQQNIMVNANPVVSVSAIGTICQNAQPVQIIENRNGFTGTGVFNGTGVTSTGLFDPSAAGVGVFTINYVFTDQNGCTYSSSQPVTVYPAPTVSLVSDLVLLDGGQVTLPAVAPGDGLNYQWTPSLGLDHDNILNPIASPTETTTYKLIVTNIEGCSVAAEVVVNVLKLPSIPNTFTPNGDGINDTWDILHLNEYQDCTVNVFNRYGQKVYSSNGYSVPWDGKFHGTDLPQGTYYYIINPGNGRKGISGSVTIIR